MTTPHLFASPRTGTLASPVLIASKSHPDGGGEELAARSSSKLDSMSRMKRTLRALVVDDDDDIRETVRIALELNGFEVDVARDGAEGLVAAERRIPDLLVVDMMMPRRSGFSVIERLEYRKRFGLKIVMISGDDNARQCFGAI